jgi:hypothetical protein
MFILPTGLRFARSDTPAPLREAFGAMATVVSPFAQDSDTETETFWASLHGLTELERHGRCRCFRVWREGCIGPNRPPCNSIALNEC